MSRKTGHGIAASALAVLTAAATFAAIGSKELRRDDLIAIASASEKKRDWKSALDVWNSIIDLDEAGGDDSKSGLVQSLTAVSRAQLKLEDFRAALATAQRGFAIAPDDGRVAIARGESLLRAGELEGAREVFRDSVRLAPGSAQSHLGLGRLLVASGDQEAGIAEIARAHEIAPDDTDVLFRYAGAVANRADAVAVLERYLALSEGDDPEKRESIRGTVDYYKALGETPLWVIAKAPESTGIPLATISSSPGVLQGYVVELRAPERERERDGEPEPGVTGTDAGRAVRHPAKSRRIRCLLDSGASGLYLSRGIAAKLRQNALSEATLFGGGGSERHETSRVLLPSVAIGDLEFTSVPVTIAPGELDRAGRFDAILGIDVFDRFPIAIDLPRRRLSIDGMKKEPAEASSSVPVRSSPVWSIPIWSIEGQLLVRVDFGNGRNGLMMLDTGADRTVIALSAADRLEGLRRTKRSTPTYGFGGEVARVEEIEGLPLHIAGIDRKGLPFLGIDLSRRSRLSGVEISGYLGLDVLREYRLEFDAGQSRMRVARSR